MQLAYSVFAQRPSQSARRTPTQIHVSENGDGDSDGADADADAAADAAAAADADDDDDDDDDDGVCVTSCTEGERPHLVYSFVQNRRGGERMCKALPNEALCTSSRKRELITPVYLRNFNFFFLNC